MDRKRSQGARSKARRRALQAIYQWLMSGDSAESILRQFLEEQNFNGIDEEFFKLIVTGATVQSEENITTMKPVLSMPWERLDVTEKAILLIACYELGTHPEIPHQVIINEALELSHDFGAEDAHTFINAVLDRITGKYRDLDSGNEK